MNTTTLGERGQVVIPQAIREQLKLAKGDSFAIAAEQNAIVLKKVDWTAEFKEVMKKIRATPHVVTRRTKAEKRALWEKFINDPNRSDIFRKLGLDDAPKR